MQSLRRVLAMARKEFRQLVRDRLTLGMIVGIPSLQLMLFGYAINLDVRHISTALLDRAASSLSRRLVGELEATQTFRIRRAVGSEAEAFRLLERSEVGAVVVVPPDLDRRFYRGRGVELSILVDASDPTVASAVALSGEGFGRTLASRLQPFRTGEPTAALRLTRQGRDQSCRSSCARRRFASRCCPSTTPSGGRRSSSCLASSASSSP